jgi:hypothetical protein
MIPVCLLPSNIQALDGIGFIAIHLKPTRVLKREANRQLPENENKGVTESPRQEENPFNAFQGALHSPGLGLILQAW